MTNKKAAEAAIAAEAKEVAITEATKTVSEAITAVNDVQYPVKRQGFKVLIEVIDGNINGDPDNENAPRADHETGHGLVTDVCIKRKIRDAVALIIGKDKLYVKHRGVLATEQEKAYKETNQVAGKTSNMIAQKWMCDNYWDVAAFGGLMTGGKSDQITESADDDEPKVKEHRKAKTSRFDCGAVRGAVQVSIGRTIDPICIMEHAITRVALTNRNDGGKSTENEDGELVANSGQMGKKQTACFGLYEVEITVNPFLALEVGYTNEANDLLIYGILHMFDNDASAARPNIRVRAVYHWTHKDALGNASSWRLFDSVKVEKKADVKFPRSFDDYTVTVDDTPEGVTFEELVAPKATGASN